MLPVNIGCKFKSKCDCNKSPDCPRCKGTGICEYNLSDKYLAGDLSKPINNLVTKPDKPKKQAVDKQMLGEALAKRSGRPAKAPKQVQTLQAADQFLGNKASIINIVGKEDSDNAKG